MLKIDDQNEQYGPTFIKLQGNLDIIHVFQKGLYSIFGPSQLMKSQRMKFDINMVECKMPLRKPASPFARFICQESTIDFVNKNMDNIIKNRFIHEFISRNDATYFNKWQSLPTIDYSFHALCLGIQPL